jgi:capsid assembly protease
MEKQFLENFISEFNKTAWAVLPERLVEMSKMVELAENGIELTADEKAERLALRGGRPNMAGGAVAVLPLVGPISHRSNFFTEFFGGASVEGFKKQFRQALNDDAVNSIVIDIDSPGGSVDGVAELADEIFHARAKGKKIIAVANAMAASAAFWIGTAAEEFIVTPSGEVGSVGVFSLHLDHSELLAKEGIKPTFISAGKFKVEGNPFEPLSDEARAAIQADINIYYDQFVKALARNRGTSVSDVKANFGQGRTLLAKDAVKAGMVDRVATLDAVIGKLAGRKSAQASINISEVELASPQEIVTGPQTAFYRNADGQLYKLVVEAKGPEEPQANDIELKRKELELLTL